MVKFGMPLRLLFATALLLGVADPALSRCSRSTHQEIYDDADVVFSGTVVSTEYDANAIQYRYDIGRARWKFRVVEVWKGHVSHEIDVVIPTDSCGGEQIILEIGAELLIHGSYGRDGLATSACGGIQYDIDRVRLQYENPAIPIQELEFGASQGAGGAGPLVAVDPNFQARGSIQDAGVAIDVDSADPVNLATQALDHENFELLRILISKLAPRVHEDTRVLRLLDSVLQRGDPSSVSYAFRSLATYERLPASVMKSMTDNIMRSRSPENLFLWGQQHPPKSLAIPVLLHHAAEAEERFGIGRDMNAAIYTFLIENPYRDPRILDLLSKASPRYLGDLRLTALAAYGEPGLRRIAQEIEGEAETTAARAIEKLMLHAPDWPPFHDSLRQALRSPSVLVRAAALWAIETLDPWSGRAIAQKWVEGPPKKRQAALVFRCHYEAIKLTFEDLPYDWIPTDIAALEICAGSPSWVLHAERRYRSTGGSRNRSAIWTDAVKVVTEEFVIWSGLYRVF